MMLNLLDFDRARLSAFLEDKGEKKFRVSQIFKWVYGHGVVDFSEMNNINKVLRTMLRENFEVNLPVIIDEQVSRDGTRKWLLQLSCGNSVETVYIPEAERGTLCVSSQVGCALDCSFCVTGKQGFNRNLTTAEIIAQLWIAKRAVDQDSQQSAIRNVVFMGMGEPLLNLRQVMPAIRIMLDDDAYGLAKRRITVSTAGVVPMMEQLRLAEGMSGVGLAVSLHAANDKLRDELVPINTRYPLHKLMEACWAFVEGQHKYKITFEYVMLKGVNDSLKHAHQMVKLLGGLPAKINLIPFNEGEGIDYECSDQRTIDAFRDVLTSKGLITITRKTRGDDISAACGQLAGTVKNKMKRNPLRNTPLQTINLNL